MNNVTKKCQFIQFLIFFSLLLWTSIVAFVRRALEKNACDVQLTWYDDDGDEITDGIEKTEELLSDGKRFTVKSTLKLLAQSEHHNATFTCRSKSAADKVAKNAEIKIEVIGLQRMPFFLERTHRERERERVFACADFRLVITSQITLTRFIRYVYTFSTLLLIPVSLLVWLSVCRLLRFHFHTYTQKHKRRVTCRY